MKSYRPIPEVAEFRDYDELSDAIARLFVPYGATGINYGIGFPDASFRIHFPDGPLELQIAMPHLYDWLFIVESPSELQEGFKSIGEDYEPLRCFPSDVSNAWHRLLLYRAARFLAALRSELGRIEVGELTFQGAFPSRKMHFDGHCDLTSIPEDETTAAAASQTGDIDAIGY
jgi:hypothetical protein